MDINTLKSWFRNGLKPTQEQFWSLIDSFRHKDDPVPVSEVAGLPSMLAGKADQGHKHTLADITDYNEEKEVLNGLLAMEASELEALPRTDGMYYIVLADDTLYRCAYNEDTEEYNLEQVLPSSRVIYSVKDSEGSMRIYLFSDNQGVFQDVTGEVVDKTIYVQSLDELIGKELSDGVFTVSHVTEDNDNSVYVMTVSGQSRVLESKDGWAHVSNGEWSWKKYAYEGHGHELSDVSGLGTELASKAPMQHTHGTSDVTGLSALLEGLTNLISGRSEKGHKHTLDDITNIDDFKVDVDSELSDTSENPVQNKVVKAAIERVLEQVNSLLSVSAARSYTLDFGTGAELIQDVVTMGNITIDEIVVRNVAHLYITYGNVSHQEVNLSQAVSLDIPKNTVISWEIVRGIDDGLACVGIHCSINTSK